MTILKNKFVNNIFNRLKEYIDEVIKEQTKSSYLQLKADVSALKNQRDSFKNLVSEEVGNIRKEVSRAKKLSDPRHIHYETFFLTEDADTFILDEKNLLVLKPAYQKERGRYAILVEIYIDGVRQMYCPSAELDYSLKKNKNNELVIEFFEPINEGAFVEVKAYKEI